MQVCPSCRFEANYSSFVPFLEKHGTCPMCDQEIVRAPRNRIRKLEKSWKLVLFLEMVWARMTAALLSGGYFAGPGFSSNPLCCAWLLTLAVVGGLRR